MSFGSIFERISPILEWMRQVLPAADSDMGDSGLKEEYFPGLALQATDQRPFVHSRHRRWSAYNGLGRDELYRDSILVGHTVIEGIEKISGHFSQSASACRPILSQSGAWNVVLDPPSEATTMHHLIVPVLNAIGWSRQPGPRLDFEAHLPGVGRADARCGPTVFEFKKAWPQFDHLDAWNTSNPRFSTVLDQCMTYLSNDGVSCVIFSNGRFWWRIERDEITGHVYALRFNMWLAQSAFRNRLLWSQRCGEAYPPRSNDLERFVQMFHGKAFSPGNNMSIDVHVGMERREYANSPETLFLKDLNNGF